MFSEKDVVTYGIIGLFGLGAIIIVDAYVKGVQEYVPLMLELKR